MRFTSTIAAAALVAVFAAPALAETSDITELRRNSGHFAAAQTAPVIGPAAFAQARRHAAPVFDAEKAMAERLSVVH